MISDLNPQYQSFLADVNQIRLRLQTAQTQLSTGLKINNVSDAPEQIAELWQTQSQLGQVQQIDTNLDSVSTEVNTAESALQSADTLLQRAVTIGAEGTSSTATAATQEDLAGEVGSVLQQLVAAANTQVAGRYIFAGDTDATQPYSIDLTQTSPVSAYQGSASTRQVQSPDGTSFSIALTAQQIFDSPDAQDNIFSSINNLMQGLTNNNATEISNSLNAVQTSDIYLNQQLAFYGAVQDRVTNAQTFGQNYVVQLETQLSGIQDADETASITDLTQATTQLQAALQSEGALPRTTLFDFLG